MPTKRKRERMNRERESGRENGGGAAGETERGGKKWSRRQENERGRGERDIKLIRISILGNGNNLFRVLHVHTGICVGVLY